MSDTPDNAPLKDALEKNDAMALARLASDAELGRLKIAEEVLEKRHDRQQRTRRTARIASAMVGYVALAGFFANAYQNYKNKQDSDRRSVDEGARWEKEFKRAQDADKYRAFFETSALATDSQNPDKRLVGYALLKEFVDDQVYNSKAIIMLEESLALELRSGASADGMDDERRLAVMAILTALSHTNDCHALEGAARTVERLAKLRRPPHRHVGPARGATSAATAVPGAPGAVPTPPARDPRTIDPGSALSPEAVEDLSEVFELYVRRLLGRAAITCGKARDFRDVRQPIRDALVVLPALGSAKGKLKPAEANLRIAELLRDGCLEDLEDGVVSDCAESWRGYGKLCAEMKKQPEWGDEQAACDTIGAALTGLTAAR